MPRIRRGPPCFRADLSVYSGRFRQPFPRGGWFRLRRIEASRHHLNSPTQIPGYAEGNQKMRLKILTLAAAMTVLAACADKPANNAGAAGGPTAVAPVATGTTDLATIFKTQVGDRIFFDFD